MTRNRDHTTADRGTLHESSVEDVAAWAVEKGWRREPVPATSLYEALRLRPKNGGAPVLFYRREHLNCRGGAPKHLSTSQDGARLVRQWLSERRKAAMSEADKEEWKR